MERFIFSMGCITPDADGDYVRHSDAIAYAEECKKQARREALEEADLVVCGGCVKSIRELMEKDDD